MKLKVCIIYDSDKRYIFDFELAKKVLELSEEDEKKLEIAIKKEIVKNE